VLGRQVIGGRVGRVGDVARHDLAVEPLADVALAAAGALGDVRRGERPGAGGGAVQAELVSEARHHAAVAGGDVAEHLADERLELSIIDGDRVGHGSGGCPRAGSPARVRRSTTGPFVS